jgi:hypothetical protein
LLVIPDLPGLDGPELERHIALHEALSRMPVDERGRVVADLRLQLTLPPATRGRLSEFLDQRPRAGVRLGGSPGPDSAPAEGRSGPGTA